MAVLNYSNVGISAMSGCVPKKVIDNYQYDLDVFRKEDVKKIVDKLGIPERRFADEKTCASDLCAIAAEQLIADNSIDRNEIDLLVFVSQTPDYRSPATAILLQHRLGLPMSCIAFDVNLGCSGFLFGLSVVYSFMEKHGMRKALLLDGDTCSKVYNRKDRRSAFIFGDAGVAVLVERDEKFGTSWFSLNNDGSRGDLIMIPGGGYRKMSSSETLKEKVVDEYGNIRSEEDSWMKGDDVFNFVIVEIPADIKRLMTVAGENLQSMDYYVFHQSNLFINSFLAKKLKLDKAKMPQSFHKYGNTSSVSVPLTMVSELQGQLVGQKKILLSAFGVGMSWGTAILTMDNCKISDVIEY